MALFVYFQNFPLTPFLRNEYKKESHLHPLIKTYTFINFWENLPPTRLLGPQAYWELQSIGYDDTHEWSRDQLENTHDLHETINKYYF